MGPCKKGKMLLNFWMTDDERVTGGVKMRESERVEVTELGDKVTEA